MKQNAYSEMFEVEDTHWWYVILHDLVTSLCRTQFPQRSLKILDAGCGTGGLLKILSKGGHNVEGFDLSEDALNFCRERGLPNIFKADINNWNPSPETYDLITVMDVLYHEWVYDEVKVLRNLASGLKENGLLMANYPAFPILSRQHDKAVMTRERYTRKTLKLKLLEADLTPVILSYRLPHAFFYLFFLRMREVLKKNKTKLKSDIAEIPSKFINQSLVKIGQVENRIIAQKISILLGSSLFVVAKRID